jgi:uncharacterized protein YndB with AHSA1/START domain
VTPAPSRQPVVRLHRLIPAPPDRVYRAWLDPDVLRLWLAPGELQVTRVEIDERVGGHFRVWHGTSDGDVGGFECELLELIPGERIVFRWGFVGPDRADGRRYDSRLTITLAAAPDGPTALTLVHERLNELQDAAPEVAEKVGAGWDMVLDTLIASIRRGDLR